MLVDDPEDLVHKAVGWMLREAGKRDERQAAFLDRHAATMPRVMLRYAIEKLDKPTRDRYLAMRTQRLLRPAPPAFHDPGPALHGMVCRPSDAS